MKCALRVTRIILDTYSHDSWATWDLLPTFTSHCFQSSSFLFTTSHSSHGLFPATWLFTSAPFILLGDFRSPVHDPANALLPSCLMPWLPVTFLSSQLWQLFAIVTPWTRSLPVTTLAISHPNLSSSSTPAAESFPIMATSNVSLRVSLDTQSLFLSSSLSCLDTMTHH